MKLSKCQYGVLVQKTDITQEVGMVVGITNNCPSADVSVRREVDRAVPLVQWSCGETYCIHPGNIKLFKE